MPTTLPAAVERVRAVSPPWWHEDVALEVWVDTVGDRARVRLAGRLDGETADHVASVLGTLAAEGVRHVEVGTDGVVVADSAVAKLRSLQRLCLRSDLALHWAVRAPSDD